jgi:hypothetical protein
VGLKSLKSLNLTNGYPNNKNKKKKKKNNNKVKSKPLWPVHLKDADTPSIEGIVSNVLFICLSSARQLKCLRVSKTESYGISRICFEMTRQATMPSSSEKCLRVSKTESYGLSRICFEMTRQATMPSSKA